MVAKISSSRGRGKYGEKTVPIRVPLSMVDAVERMLESRKITENQWNQVVLPPVARHLVNVITDYMTAHYSAFVGCMLESGDPRLMGPAGELKERVEAVRDEYKKLVQDGILEAVNAGVWSKALYRGSDLNDRQ